MSLGQTSRSVLSAVHGTNDDDDDDDSLYSSSYNFSFTFKYGKKKGEEEEEENKDLGPMKETVYQRPSYRLLSGAHSSYSSFVSYHPVPR